MTLIVLDTDADCVLSAIGKPVYHRFSDTPYGSWMRDAMPRSTLDGDKYWATKYNDSYHLYEYTNKTSFKKDIFVKNYTLPFALQVTLQSILIPREWNKKLDDANFWSNSTKCPCFIISSLR